MTTTEQSCIQPALVSAGRIEDFERGKFRFVQIGTDRVGVLLMADGEFRAVRDHCPHRGAPICKGPVTGTWPPSLPSELVYDREGEILVCPWHGLEYDLRTGKEMFGTGMTRLRFYKTVIENGEVFVTR